MLNILCDTAILWSLSRRRSTFNIF